MISSGLKSIVGSALILAAASCAAHVAPTTQPVFFPPPPTPPRLQFLTSFSGSKDLEKQSTFNRFVAGENQDQKLDKPYGVAVWGGRIYVCDTNAGVFVFDLKVKRYGALKGAVGPGKLLQPINVSVDEDGVKYVADPVRGQVVAFDRNDEYLKAYGTPGAWRPVDAVRFADRLYVVDTLNHVVAVLDLASGTQVATFGDRGEPTDRLDRPTNVSLDREGALYVTDSGKFQVLKFDRDGRFLAAFGKPGDNLGHFARPKGTALDREGRLYAVDASFNNVQLFDKGGRLLMFFGDGGEAAGDFLLPAKVTIDYDNVSHFQQYIQPDFQAEYLVLVTSQFGPRLVNVLAYGRAKGQPYPTDDELLRQIEERRRNERETVEAVMRQRTRAMSAVVVLALSVACSVEARHKTLTTFFDGVPPPKAELPAGSPPAAGARHEPAPQVAFLEHGPYAAKLCGACHDTSAANAMVAPKDQLCRQCHELKADWKYAHGPQASGACLACHDPHRSKEAGLLVASGDAVCLRCHERSSLSHRREEHADPGPGCITCHDAHGSDSKYLLR